MSTAKQSQYNSAAFGIGHGRPGSSARATDNIMIEDNNISMFVITTDNKESETKHERDTGGFAKLINK